MIEISLISNAIAGMQLSDKERDYITSCFLLKLKETERKFDGEKFKRDCGARLSMKRDSIEAIMPVEKYQKLKIVGKDAAYKFAASTHAGTLSEHYRKLNPTLSFKLDNKSDFMHFLVEVWEGDVQLGYMK